MVANTTKQAAFIRAVSEVPVVSHLDYREYLQDLYTCMKRILERYSYLEFADDLGFSRTNVLHLVITGKRPLTLKGAIRVANAVQLKGLERRYLETLVLYCNSRKPPEREELFRELLTMKNRTLKSALERSQLEYFSEWYHPIIREMMMMTEFHSDPEWIASRLDPRIRPEQARRSLELLERLGLAAYDSEKRRHVPAAAQVTTGDDIESISVIRYHQRMIELGKEAITAADEMERDVSAITVCVSPETAARLRWEIRDFRKRLLALADESNHADRVYQLNFQLFPVTSRK